ncbi:SCO2524 family protein [Nocardia sp. NBC_00565]|uniref:SCO2524 family protein n=1 Tax=Nocardia sp. NBC_00565 TaxID=2975993 RepID=UPI002E816CF5|nr:SCO2524 family protein [Nocardia sp. NBC_00565]WUC00534.1 SCO2524 family protein [Nocardia sp. NBC_00565]
MRIRPRQQLLDLWRAVLAYSYRDEKWIWGGRDGANSISDAEQLLCLLYPATEIDAFALHQPDEMAADAKTALALFGEETRIGRVLVDLLDDYLDRYAGADGRPIFAAGSYLHSVDEKPPSEAQLALEVVDSYSMSLSLCIASMRFLRGFDRFVRGEVRMEARKLRERIPLVIDKVSTRLTAAMAGLVRSFVIHTPESKMATGQEILNMINQSRAPADDALARLSARLEQLRVRAASEVRLGQPAESDIADDKRIDIADDKRLFECGWGWGIVHTAEPIDFVPGHVGTATGLAEPRPYLYFTAVALDGIIDLASQRIRELDLLTDEQRKLADALALRFELTRNYWSTVARFGSGRWPLEDIPWRTSDGEESDYFSLAVSAMLIQDLVYRDSTEDLARTVAVFDQLARRGRITSRLTSGDPAATLHYPGVRMRLAGSEHIGGGPQLEWYVPDFVTMMLKRCLQAARLRTEVDTRDQLMALAESAMDHIDSRMLRDSPARGLWDDPGWLFDTAKPIAEGPSWFVTERVMECLVIAHDTFSRPPLAPKSMVSRAVDLLSEAEHLLNQEELEVEGDDVSPRQVAVNRIRQSLDRARRVLNERPGTAYGLATQALTQLDELAYARHDATR